MILATYSANFPYWELYHKVTFDGQNKIIKINNGVTDLNFLVDVYSSWKEWALLESNTKYIQALRVVGGDPTTGGNRLGSTFFLMFGWKMQTWSGDHRLTITGNVYSEDGSNIFIPPEEPAIIEINLTVSNLIDAPALSGGGITVDDILDEDLTSHNVPNSTADVLKKTKIGVEDNTALILSK